MSNWKRGLYLVGGLIGLAVIFQLFLRYQYIHTYGRNITRIDRLTRQSCELPCRPVTFTPAAAAPVATDALDALAEKRKSSPTPDDPYHFKTP